MMTKYVVGLGRTNRQYISESRERLNKEEKQKTKIVEPELIYNSCCYIL